MKQIRESQDIEEQLEQEKDREIKVRKEIGAEIEAQEGAKKDLDQHIYEAKIHLEKLKKQSKMASTASQKQSAAPSHSKKKQLEEEADVNIEHLMEDLKKDIALVYHNKDYSLGDTTDLNSKQAIQLLHEIELKIDTYIKEIGYIMNPDPVNLANPINNSWNAKVHKEEKERKTKRFEDQKKERENLEREKKLKVQQKLELRMKDKVKRVGKMEMTRSQKPKVKQEKVQKVIDQETQDQRLYLGTDLKTMEAELENNNKK